MKTDSDLLFEYTEGQIKEHNYDCLELTWDLYGELPENIDPVIREIFHIKTHYEKLFTAKGATIKYAKFKIHQSLIIIEAMLVWNSRNPFQLQKKSS